MTAQPLDGRTVVITGASDGVGAAVARALADSGATLLLTGRSAEKTAAAGKAARAAATFTADFARLAEVRRLAAEIRDTAPRIDVLVNNAGGLFDPSAPTPDGFEPNTQVNHLAPFLLTNLLRDRLAAAPAGALVLNTSSIGNVTGRVRPDRLGQLRPAYLQGSAYGSSKLMNILFTRGIARRWAGDRIVSTAIHPGPVASGFGRDSAAMALFRRTPLARILISSEAAAGPLVELVRGGADPAVDGVYFSRARPSGFTHPQSRDARVADQLWTASAELVGL